MSNLKHLTIPELRAVVRSCVAKRKYYEEEIAVFKAGIAQLQKKLEDMGKASHNIGQREAWARKYLAEKELKK